MQKLKSIGLGLLVALGLAACATQEVYEPVQKGMRVGVASVIGDALYYRKMAAVSVGNETDGANISEWGFDPFIEGEAAARLAQTQTVESMVFDRSLRDPIEIAYSAALNMTEPVDAYIVVVPAERPVAVARENNAQAANSSAMYGVIGVLMASALVGDHHDYTGLGLYRAPNSGDRYVYAVADLVLIDGTTFEETRRTPLYTTVTPEGSVMLSGVETKSDMRIMKDEGAWPSDVADFTPEQLQAVSDALAILLQGAISNSLQKLGMAY